MIFEPVQSLTSTELYRHNSHSTGIYMHSMLIGRQGLICALAATLTLALSTASLAGCPSAYKQARAEGMAAQLDDAPATYSEFSGKAARPPVRKPK
jgi:hypothetical protein